MAGSIQPLRPSTTFALRRCGCFAVVLCAVWFVAGACPAPAGIINAWRSHGPEGGLPRGAGRAHSRPTEPRFRPGLQERVTPAPAAACNRLACDEPIPQTPRLSVSVARHPSTDAVLSPRHRRLKIRRFRRSFAGLPSSTARRNELRGAGIAGALAVANLHLPAPSRDHARAPPPPNYPA
jgi:hypothetical protein